MAYFPFVKNGVKWPSRSQWCLCLWPSPFQLWAFEL